MVNKNRIEEFIEEVRKYLFKEYFVDNKGDRILKIKNLFLENISENNFNNFKNKLADIKILLDKDLEFFLKSDPAIDSKEEVIIAYPGFYAILVYRIANLLTKFDIPLIPRVISEIAHSKTGIDIHPRATIGCPFFIDHGTGIVIGETSEIGNYVKMYHGVTLGALSLENASELKNKKRHPTIKDYVTIYSGASILGGDTIIGEHVTIGSNVFIINSVLAQTKIIYNSNYIKLNNDK